jgi:SAM-dependent methyltransferase
MPVTKENVSAAKLRCLRCGAHLAIDPGRCVCPACAAEWPIVRGIARFAAPPYWGEMPRPEASDLVADAERRGWRQAVERRFPAGDMRISILDTQRAAWLPLLGLGPEAVALDVGSGMGAITHALARGVGEVYSLEAVTERVEFTRARLSQEGLGNVHLVQGSALSLPFHEGMFDLVVVNGILEWVGEWEAEGSPRQAQLRFLRNVAKLLKPAGVVVIGIENRFAYSSILGAMDHSGLAYTNLMPRRVASWWLRRHARDHHRTQLNARREYRTYTYSAAGYRALLGEAGLGSTRFFWADPGYNQPYHLIPLVAREMVRAHLLDSFRQPGPKPSRAVGPVLRRALARMPGLGWVAPDFVIFASTGALRGGWLADWLCGDVGLPARGEELALSSYTAPFATKQVMRVARPRAARHRVAIKVEVPALAAGLEPGQEFENLRRIWDHLARRPAPSFRVPRPVAAQTVGCAAYTAEEHAHGAPWSRAVWRPGYFRDGRRVRREFERATRAASELSQTLASVTGLEPTGRGFCGPPVGAEGLPLVQAAVERLRTRADRNQHGDLTVENVFLAPGGGAVEIIDWASLGGGYPPLYDHFSLLLSSGYRDRGGTASAGDEGAFWVASFADLFLSTASGIAALVAELTEEACASAGLDPAQIPDLLAEFLVVRTNSFRARGSLRAEMVHLGILKALASGPERMVLGRRPPRSARAAGRVPG